MECYNLKINKDIILKLFNNNFIYLKINNNLKMNLILIKDNFQDKDLLEK